MLSKSAQIFELGTYYTINLQIRIGLDLYRIVKVKTTRVEFVGIKQDDIFASCQDHDSVISYKPKSINFLLRIKDSIQIQLSIFIPVKYLQQLIPGKGKQGHHALPL